MGKNTSFWMTGVFLVCGTLLFHASAVSQVYAVSDSAIGLINKGNFRKAVDYLGSEIMKQEDEPAALLRLLGQAHYNLLEYDDAIDAYRRAARSSDCDTCSRDLELAGVIAMEAKQFGTAKECLGAALSRGSETAGLRIASVFYLEGEAYIQKLDYASATDAYQAGLKYREDTLLYERLLFCYYKRDMDETVLRLCDTLRGKHPDFSSPRKFTGLINLAGGSKAIAKERYEEAAGLYRKALGDLPECAPAYYGLGICYEKLKDTAHAIEHYTRAVELGIVEPGTYCDFAKLYIAGGKFPDAEKVLRKGLRRIPGYALLWEIMGGLYEKMGKKERSETCSRMSGFLGSTAHGRYRTRPALSELKEILEDSSPAGSYSIWGWTIVRDPRDATPDPPDSLNTDSLPRPLQQVPPEYPELARIGGIKGTVWVKMLVDREGKAKKCIVTSSEAEIFNQPSLEAAIRWVFKPAELNGKPVECWVHIPFRYALN